MSMNTVVLSALLTAFAVPAFAAQTGNAETGRQLVLKSCSACHGLAADKSAADSAPPLSFLAKDNKARPAWVRGWLMDPHPPMPSISLSRAQIADVIAYLNTLPAD